MAENRRSKSAKDGPGFEDLLGRIEEIVSKLEQGDLPLEESVRLFEEGMRLCADGTRLLDQAEARVRVLMEGPPAAEPEPAP